ncbi:MAG: hypothetical protein V3R62_10545, partial [Acidiferrobacterales bacterium]
MGLNSDMALSGVLLDRATIDSGDIDFSDLESIFPQWDFYDFTARQQVDERIRDTAVVVSN